MFRRKVYVVEQKGMTTLNHSHDELVQVEDYKRLLHDLKIETCFLGSISVEYRDFKRIIRKMLILSKKLET